MSLKNPFHQDYRKSWQHAVKLNHGRSQYPEPQSGGRGGDGGGQGISAAITHHHHKYIFLRLAESTVWMMRNGTRTANITHPLGQDRDTESAARGNVLGNLLCVCWGDVSSNWEEWSVIVTFPLSLLSHENWWKSTLRIQAFSKMLVLLGWCMWLLRNIRLDLVYSGSKRTLATNW